MNRNLARRREYSVGELTHKNLDSNPLKQFQKWFKVAERKNIHTPNAATFATASKIGKPSARIVLIKSSGEKGFDFFTNYDSNKAKDLKTNPQAELVFYWPELERQIRIFGKVTKLSKKESEAYFKTRPRGAQLAAWASEQSQATPSRQSLLKVQGAYNLKFSDQLIPKPPRWGGYLLKPQSYEFWQGRPDRLNDRFLYRKGRNKLTSLWTITQLQP